MGPGLAFLITACHSAIPDSQLAGGQISNLGIVADQDDGHAVSMQRSEEVHDVSADHRVEVAGGFVGEDDIWAFHHGPCDGDALLFAAGKLTWPMSSAFAQTDFFQGFPGPFVDIRFTGVHERQADVFQRGFPGKEIEGLKDEADALVAGEGQLPVPVAGCIFTIKEVAAFARVIEASEDVEQGGFAGAGGAHDGDEFTTLHGEIDIVKRVDLKDAVLIDLVNAVEVEQMFVHACRNTSTGSREAARYAGMTVASAPMVIPNPRVRATSWSRNVGVQER